jgi:hypothetical protein
MNSDLLARAYRSGASLEALAQATGWSYGTVRQRLIGADVEMRRRGPRPVETGHQRLPKPRQAGMRAARAAKLAGSPAQGRSVRPSGRPSPEAVDDELVGMVRTAALDLLAERGLEAALEQVPDDELLLAMQELRIALDGGRPLTSPTGSTRGVRRNPTTGETERF